MGLLYGVTVDIDGPSVLADFEVIEIVDDSNSYPVLLGIDGAIDMDTVINLKEWNMTFERKLLRVVVRLDHAEGENYNELVCDFVESGDDLDHIYKITMQNEEWINLTADG